MSVKIVLQNAKAQLEAQKVKAYQEAYNEKYAELKPHIDTYSVEKKKEYDEAVVALKGAFDEAINAKKAEVESLSANYATVKVATIDNSIAELDAMISKAKD